ncbi:phosphocarrier protein [Endobacter medicaginis]|uniref:Phosphocarrier protein n=1 Tax=Endobacter medicaginis TaxID=1181271 RepID=A0A839UYN8_9PROT|nr:HPr family phosphocarrier protein [Endobacter medicaginis]MBB3174896.1 phosphocarrier protein [Endobacter medicaginis]MCX5475859.1 HPr family phosphocarrier protein [Endobacter medicaginis]
MTLRRRVAVTNRRGLHARAAAKFVVVAERFDIEVTVLRDGQSVSARSIMGLMMLGAGRGSEIEFEAPEGGEAAIEALAALVEARFDEDE